MKKLILFVLLLFSFLCCAPDIPVDQEDIDEIKEKLEQCIANLDEAQAVFEQLMEELQKYIDKE